ncbi:MAG TPA: hypothetical protein EYG65_00925 [Rhodospirillales bacterium]|nr:hypothetical protein [Rhodospirillales bacterium]
MQQQWCRNTARCGHPIQENGNRRCDAAELAKHQILAQSATAMLAQASAISQNILSLLR